MPSPTGKSALSMVLANIFREWPDVGEDNDHGHEYVLPSLLSGVNRFALKVTDARKRNTNGVVPPFFVYVTVESGPSGTKVQEASFKKPGETVVELEPKPANLLALRNTVKQSVLKRFAELPQQDRANYDKIKIALDTCRRMVVDPEIKHAAEKTLPQRGRGHEHFARRKRPAIDDCAPIADPIPLA